MDTFLELVKSRQSDRGYDFTRAVEQEKLDYILKAACLAPSACNAQPWSFIVVNDTELKQKMGLAISTKAIGMNNFANQAPVQIIILEESANLTSKVGSFLKRKHFPLLDIGIITAHLTLAAAEQGLGTCIVGWFNEKKVRTIFNIPSSSRPLLIITLGYSTDALREKKRKPMNDIVSYNTYK